MWTQLSPLWYLLSPLMRNCHCKSTPRENNTDYFSRETPHSGISGRRVLTGVLWVCSGQNPSCGTVSSVRIAGKWQGQLSKAAFQCSLHPSPLQSWWHPREPQFPPSSPCPFPPASLYLSFPPNLPHALSLKLLWQHLGCGSLQFPIQFIT